MRRSGRTTRIANFVVDQLMSQSRCITTDHTQFETSQHGIDSLKNLISVVENKIFELFGKKRLLRTCFVRVNGIVLVDFTLSFPPECFEFEILKKEKTEESI